MLRRCENCPASIYVGIALCHYKLGHMDLAEESLQTALLTEVLFYVVDFKIIMNNNQVYDTSGLLNMIFFFEKS